MHWGHARQPRPRALDLSADHPGTASGNCIPVGASPAARSPVPPSPSTPKGGHCPGDDAAAIRFYLTRHFEVPGRPDTVEECQTTCVSTDSLTAGPETVVVRARGALTSGRDFRDAKIETGFGDAIMILATNLPSDQVPASGETGVSDANEGGWFTLSPHGEPDVDQPDSNRIPSIVTFRNDTPRPGRRRLDLCRPRWWPIAAMPKAAPTSVRTRSRWTAQDVAIGAIMHIRTKDGCFQPIRWYTGRAGRAGALGRRPFRLVRLRRLLLCGAVLPRRRRPPHRHRVDRRPQRGAPGGARPGQWRDVRCRANCMCATADCSAVRLTRSTTCSSAANCTMSGENGDWRQQCRQRLLRGPPADR